MAKVRVYSSPLWCCKVGINLPWKKRTPCNLQNGTHWLQIFGVLICSHRNCPDNFECWNCLLFSNFNMPLKDPHLCDALKSSSSNYWSFSSYKILMQLHSIINLIIGSKIMPLMCGNSRNCLNWWCIAYSSWPGINSDVYICP